MFLARNETGKPIQVYEIDDYEVQGSTRSGDIRGVAIGKRKPKAGPFNPKLGGDGAPSHLCTAGFYAIAESRGEAMYQLMAVQGK